MTIFKSKVKMNAIGSKYDPMINLFRRLSSLPAIFPTTSDLGQYQSRTPWSKILITFTSIMMLCLWNIPAAASSDDVSKEAAVVACSARNLITVHFAAVVLKPSLIELKDALSEEQVEAGLSISQDLLQYSDNLMTATETGIKDFKTPGRLQYSSAQSMGSLASARSAVARLNRAILAANVPLVKFETRIKNITEQIEKMFSLLYGHQPFDNCPKKESVYPSDDHRN